MDRIERFSFLLRVLQALKDKESWCGETHIQKTLYFLQELHGLPTNYDFVLYKHGPYSFKVREDLHTLLASNYVDLKTRNPKYGPSYGLSDSGTTFLRRFPPPINGFAEAITNVAGNLGTLSVSELEGLATALFVNKKMGVQRSIEARCAELTKLKPHIPKHVALEALRRMETQIPAL